MMLHRNCKSTLAHLLPRSQGWCLAFAVLAFGLPCMMGGNCVSRMHAIYLTVKDVLLVTELRMACLRLHRNARQGGQAERWRGVLQRNLCKTPHTCEDQKQHCKEAT